MSKMALSQANDAAGGVGVSMTIELTDLQPENAPILISRLDSVTSSSRVQSAKAYSGITDNVFGSTMLVSELHP